MSRPGCWVAIATVFVAMFGDLRAQPAAGESPSDYEKDVRAACTHRRMMVRRAASGKVAQAGDAAVPALRKVAGELGLNRMPLELIDALSKAKGPTEGPMVDLLTEWASTRSFYWRALCLDGLVTREVESAAAMFRAALIDPAHLMRISGARGLLALGPRDDGAASLIPALLDDEDPRVRARVAMAMVEAGDDRELPKRRIVETLWGFERRFGDDPWGAREAQRAERALRQLTGERYDALFDEEDAAGRAEAIRRLEKWSGIEGVSGSFLTDRKTTEFLEIRSCRNGDLFLQWDADGRLFVGLDAVPTVTADGAPLLADLGGSLDERAVNGRVVCDFIRARNGSAFDHKSAPRALPRPLADGLKRLASVLDESENTELSKALTQRLRQFESPDDTR